jgi:hypothetical protein
VPQQACKVEMCSTWNILLVPLCKYIDVRICAKRALHKPEWFRSRPRGILFSLHIENSKKPVPPLLWNDVIITLMKNIEATSREF